MRCKATAHDLCAHTIWSDCRARFMCSHYTVRLSSAIYVLTLYGPIVERDYVLTLYGPIVERDLCAHTIRSDCQARFMCSHYTCEILGLRLRRR